MCMVREQCDLGVVLFSVRIFCLLQVEASRAINGATVLLWRKHCVSKQNTAAPRGRRSHGVVQLRLLKQIVFLSPSLPMPLCSSASSSAPCLSSICCFVLFCFLLYLTLFYFLIFFLDFASSNVPISLIFLLLFLFNSRHAFRPPTWLPPPPVPLFP